MADDVIVNGVPIRADDVGGVKYQYVKLDVGGDGVSVPVVGGLPTLPASAATTTRTSVASAAADTALLAANPARLGATVYNESTAILYVGYGTTAVSLTNYSVQVPAGGYLEVPAQFIQCAIRGYWAAANGYARITVG